MKYPVLALSVLGALFTISAPAAAEQQSWVDRIDFSGNARLRYEGIDEEGEEERNRMRFRARLGFSAAVSDDVKFVLRLATGGDNPVSTNQTFDDGFSTKDIGVDRAYIDWKINDELNLLGGKTKNPLFRAGGAQIAWDNDLNLEGFALTYASGRVFGTLGGFSVEERSSADDSLLYVVQGGVKLPVGDDNKLTVGAGYFAYTNTIGNTPFYNGNPRGNSVDAAGNYVNDYRNTEIFAQYDTALGSRPLQVFVHATQNNEVSDEDTAFAFGAKLGSAKKKSESEFSWTYQDVETDAVIGTFNDSNFGGANTDADGHILRAKYAYSERIFLGGSLFVNKIDGAQGAERDYNRIQLDVEFKFD